MTFIASRFSIMKAKRYFISFYMSALSLMTSQTVAERLGRVLQGSKEEEAFIASLDKTRSKQDDNSDRNLQFLKFACPGQGSSHFFKISIDVVPKEHYDVNACTTKLMRSIGHDLNYILLDYGMGDAGEGDNILYAAAVCTKPASDRRRLQWLNFVWKGGGTCRQCSSDSYDSRKLEDSNWFQDSFSPEIKNSLKTEVNETVVVKYTNCLGYQPMVNVTVNEVKSEAKAQTTCL
jgi:hypothetical protein